MHIEAPNTYWAKLLMEFIECLIEILSKTVGDLSHVVAPVIRIASDDFWLAALASYGLLR
jgi:hypothetical protein